MTENLASVSQQDLDNAIKDKFDVKYSPDETRLLKGNPLLFDGSVDAFVVCIDYFDNEDSQIKKYSVKESTQVICDEAFELSTSLESIYLPDSVKVIGARAFDSCYRLEKINLPDSIVAIKEYAFYACESIKEVTIPKNLVK